jgi:hypothetical protein
VQTSKAKAKTSNLNNHKLPFWIVDRDEYSALNHKHRQNKEIGPFFIIFVIYPLIDNSPFIPFSSILSHSRDCVEKSTNQRRKPNKH